MTSNLNSAHTATDAGVDNTTEEQAQERVYSQQEFDSAMAKLRTAVERRAVKPYQDLGTPEELRAMKTAWETQDFKTDKSSDAGRDVEHALKEIVSKKDAEIARRDQLINQYRVDAPLSDAAAKHRSVNPDQVKALLRDRVRVNTDGEVEVLDEHGRVRYSDNGDLMGVEALVKTFLDTNPHFVQANPATSNSRTSMGLQATTQIDVGQLDMKNPAHRKLYADHKKQQGLRT